MPQNLTDVNTAFSSPVVAPVDGDSANAASFVQGLQPLANRTAYLNRLVANGDTSLLNGVANIRSATTTAAMSALTGVVNLGACFVQGAGMFFYLSTSSATVDNLFVFPATGMSSGRWVHESQAVVGIAGGLAQLDSGARVTAGSVRNGIVVEGGIANPATFTTLSTTYVDVTGFSFTVSGTNPGDIVHIDLDATLTNASASYNTYCQSVVVDGGVSTTPAGMQVWMTGTSPVLVAARGLYTVVTGGTLTIKAQLKTSNSSFTATIDSASQPIFSSLRALVIRP